MHLILIYMEVEFSPVYPTEFSSIFHIQNTRLFTALAPNVTLILCEEVCPPQLRLPNVVMHHIHRLRQGTILRTQLTPPCLWPQLRGASQGHASSPQAGWWAS